MCCFLVEGYRHTRSRKKYALRLLVFALLSQFPWRLALVNNHNLNMLFTLLLCFLLLAGLDRVESRVGKGRRWPGGHSPVPVLRTGHCWPRCSPCCSAAGREEDQRKKGRCLCRLHPPLRRAQLRKLSGAAHSGAGSALDPQRHLRPGPAAVCILFLYNGQQALAGPAPLQVVLLRLLPSAPAGPGSSAAPDRVTNMTERTPRTFRPGRSLSKKPRRVPPPEAAEENQIVFSRRRVRRKNTLRGARRRRDRQEPRRKRSESLWRKRRQPFSTGSSPGLSSGA